MEWTVRLVRFDSHGCAAVGLMVPGGVVEVKADCSPFFADRETLRRAAALLHRGHTERPTELAQLELLAPAERASKVIGVGMNYRSFLRQLGEETPLHPVLFHKTAAAINAPGRAILIPPETREAVPEGELAVIIGRTGRRVRREHAIDYIAGYTCANDISARNLEFQTSQWTSGKMLETFCPLGPALVTIDEVDPLEGLEIKTFVNGYQVQSGNTRDMVFDIPDLISQISHLVTLEAGDVLLTGTPSDLGAADPAVFLADGDTVTVEIDGVGILENPVLYGTQSESPCTTAEPG